MPTCRQVGVSKVGGEFRTTAGTDGSDGYHRFSVAGKDVRLVLIWNSWISEPQLLHGPRGRHKCLPSPKTPLPRRCLQACTSRSWIGFSNRRLAALQRSSLEVNDEVLDAGDSHTVLADHLRRVVRETLDRMIGEDRLTRQMELVNRILRELEAVDPEGNLWLSTPPRRLLSVWPPETFGGGKPERPTRPWRSGACWPARGSTPASSPSSARSSPRPTASTSSARSSSGAASASWKRTSVPSPPSPSGTAPRADNQLPGATDLKAVDLLAVAAEHRGPRLLRHPSHAAARQGIPVPPRHRLRHRLHRLGQPVAAGPDRGAGVDRQGQPVRVAASLGPRRRDVRDLLGGRRVRAVPPGGAASAEAGTGRKSGSARCVRRRAFPVRPSALRLPAGDPRPARRRAAGAGPRPPPGRRRHRHRQDDDRRVRLPALGSRATSRRQAGDLRLLFVAHREELLHQSLQTFRAVLRDPNFGDLLVGGREPEPARPPVRLDPELQQPVAP